MASHIDGYSVDLITSQAIQNIASMTVDEYAVERNNSLNRSTEAKKDELRLALERRVKENKEIANSFHVDKKGRVHLSDDSKELFDNNLKEIREIRSLLSDLADYERSTNKLMPATGKSFGYRDYLDPQQPYCKNCNQLITQSGHQTYSRVNEPSMYTCKNPKAVSSNIPFIVGENGMEISVPDFAELYEEKVRLAGKRAQSQFIDKPLTIIEYPSVQTEKFEPVEKILYGLTAGIATLILSVIFMLIVKDGISWIIFGSIGGIVAALMAAEIGYIKYKDHKEKQLFEEWRLIGRWEPDVSRPSSGPQLEGWKLGRSQAVSDKEIIQEIETYDYSSETPMPKSD